MLKKICPYLAGISVLTVIVLLYSWRSAEDKIKKAEKDLADYKATIQTKINTADSLETLVKYLEQKGVSYVVRIDSLQSVIDSINIEFGGEVIRISKLFQPDELIEEMRLTFPEWKNAPMGVAKYKHPETGLSIRTMQVPVQFASTFIADHKEIAKLTNENSLLKEQTITYKDYVALKDTIITLKEEKASAYKEGMEYGLNRYEELIKEYIAELKNPKFDIQLPHWGIILGGAAAGVLIGTQLK